MTMEAQVLEKQEEETVSFSILGQAIAATK